MIFPFHKEPDKLPETLVSATLIIVQPNAAAMGTVASRLTTEISLHNTCCGALFDPGASGGPEKGWEIIGMDYMWIVPVWLERLPMMLDEPFIAKINRLPPREVARLLENGYSVQDLEQLHGFECARFYQPGVFTRK